MGDVENVRFVVNLIVVLLATPLAMVLWSMLRAAQAKATKAAEDLARHQLHAAETFATKVELAGAVNRIEGTVNGAFERFDRKLDAIDAKLDRKADK